MGACCSCTSNSALPHSILFTPVAHISSKPSGELTAVNSYLLQAKLGQGAYGSVYLCQHKTTNAKYAMKIVEKRSPRSTELDNEVLVLMRLRHRNITNLYEVIEDIRDSSNRIYLIFEYVSGGTIMSLDDNGRAIGGHSVIESDARSYMEQIVEGLSYLHRHKILHRDIKPDNILITHDRVVKISDFGVSKILQQEEGDLVRNTQGTILFYSPEMCQGEGQFNGTFCDIWALGITLFAFIYGRVPFMASNPVKLFHDIQEQELSLPAVPDISSQLKNLLHRMLAKQITGRIDLNQIRDHPWLTGEGECQPIPQPMPLPRPPRSASLARSFEDGLLTPFSKPNENVGVAGTSILVVDDVWVIRRNAEHLLRVLIGPDKGMKVHIESADDGHSALSLCAKHRYDLILMDVHMDDRKMDGYVATKTIRKMEKSRGQERSVIIGCTGDDNEEVPRKGREAGMDAVLMKPLNPTELAGLLRGFGIPVRRQALRNFAREEVKDVAGKELRAYTRVLVESPSDFTLRSQANLPSQDELALARRPLNEVETIEPRGQTSEVVEDADENTLNAPDSDRIIRELLKGCLAPLGYKEIDLVGKSTAQLEEMVQRHIDQPLASCNAGQVVWRSTAKEALNSIHAMRQLHTEVK
eukprot:TRINITY_DN7523_c0_g1_i1.p1 TRINITY_DN7523_c0_g1~~TRINITY_DN7523_c0_g1_i1.p1  ORF type:complete len:641 (-),score=141.72 TRINITY_DN7523_c0_g1_i1:811-2733(-)